MIQGLESMHVTPYTPFSSASPVIFASQFHWSVGPTTYTALAPTLGILALRRQQSFRSRRSIAGLGTRTWLATNYPVAEGTGTLAEDGQRVRRVNLLAARLELITGCFCSRPCRSQLR